MDKVLEYNTIVAEITRNDMHPGLRTIKFVFCDDKPNSNKQGVQYIDFEDIKKTAINTPVKMRFLGKASQNEKPVGGHESSIPFGFINNIVEAEDNGVHQLIADAILFADDYPEEVKYLEDSFAKGEAPGVSYEMTYKTSLFENGIEWIKNIVARAATFVSHPAYGTRTAILALAADRTISAETFMEELIALASEHSPKNTNEGGNYIMTEEEAKKLRDELAEATRKLAEAESAVTEKETALQTITSERDTLKTENETLTTENTTFKQEKVLAERLAKLTAEGITIEVKAERISKMDDETFADYVADLKAAADAGKARAENKTILASAMNRGGTPRFGTSDSSEAPTASTLAGKFKSISRSNASADTE